MKNGASRLKLRFSDIIFIAVLFSALALGSQMLNLDSDLGRHLALGSYMLDERIIPTRDLLSHTLAGLSRPPYEWLSQILFALVNRVLGLDAVILFTSFIIALTFTFVYQFANRRSGSPILALGFVLLAAGASSIHWLPRPHIFTFLLLAIWIEHLDKLSAGKHVKAYAFPAIMLLWANLHGGFIFGVLAWIAYCAGWLWECLRGKSDKKIGRVLLIAGISSLIATFVTPDLWRNWEAVFSNQSVFILNRTVETMRPILSDLSVFPFTLLLVLVVVIFVVNWKIVKPQHFFLLAGLGLVSLLMARNIPLFAIACAPILAEMGAKSPSKLRVWTQVEKRFAGFGIEGQSVWQIVVVFIATTYFAYSNIGNERPIYQFDPKVFPVEAVNFLESNPQSGNMFNEFNWGGYLEYRLWPHYDVFLDSQSDFYGENLMREYDLVMNADPQWHDILEKYQVAWVIIPVNSALADEILNKIDWEIVYTDDISMIGIRR